MSLLTVDKIHLLANRQFSRAIFMPRDPECLRSEVQLSKKHDCDISHKKNFLAKKNWRDDVLSFRRSTFMFFDRFDSLSKRFFWLTTHPDRVHFLS